LVCAQSGSHRDWFAREPAAIAIGLRAKRQLQGEK
jgi:hypothetical protein